MRFGDLIRPTVVWLPFQRHRAQWSREGCQIGGRESEREGVWEGCWTGREGELWSWKSGILMKRGRHEGEFANIDCHLIGLMDIKRFEVAEEDCDSSSIDLGKVSDMSSLKPNHKSACFDFKIEF